MLNLLGNLNGMVAIRSVLICLPTAIVTALAVSHVLVVHVAESMRHSYALECVISEPHWSSLCTVCRIQPGCPTCVTLSQILLNRPFKLSHCLKAFASLSQNDCLT